MERKTWGVLEHHRTLLVDNVDVERLYPYLKVPNHVLNPKDVASIEQQPTGPTKVAKLLELLPGCGPHAFSSLCVALENSYPHLLTIMFMGGSPRMPRSGSRTMPDGSSEISLPPSTEPQQQDTSSDTDACDKNVQTLRAELQDASKETDKLRKELDDMQVALDKHRFIHAGSPTKTIPDKQAVIDREPASSRVERKGSGGERDYSREPVRIERHGSGAERDYVITERAQVQIERRGSGNERDREPVHIVERHSSGGERDYMRGPVMVERHGSGGERDYVRGGEPVRMERHGSGGERDYTRKSDRDSGMVDRDPMRVERHGSGNERDYTRKLDREPGGIVVSGNPRVDRDPLRVERHGSGGERDYIRRDGAVEEGSYNVKQHERQSSSGDRDYVGNVVRPDLNISNSAPHYMVGHVEPQMTYYKSSPISGGPQDQSSRGFESQNPSVLMDHDYLSSRHEKQGSGDRDYQGNLRHDRQHSSSSSGKSSGREYMPHVDHDYAVKQSAADYLRHEKRDQIINVPVSSSSRHDKPQGPTQDYNKRHDHYPMSSDHDYTKLERQGSGDRNHSRHDNTKLERQGSGDRNHSRHDNTKLERQGSGDRNHSRHDNKHVNSDHMPLTPVEQEYREYGQPSNHGNHRMQYNIAPVPMHSNMDWSGGDGMPRNEDDIQGRMEHSWPPHYGTGQTSPKGSGQDRQAIRDYDWLKSQCDRAMKELQSLKVQHTETVRLCDQAVKDADKFKREYHTSKNRAETLEADLRNLQVENSGLLSERDRLEQEVKHRAAKDLDSSLSSSDEDEDEDGESLKRECESLRALHSTAAGQVEALNKENSRLRQQYEQLMMEFKTEQLEKRGFQQQCNTIIKQLDSTMKDRESLEKELARTRKEKEDNKKSMNVMKNDCYMMSKEVSRYRLERDRAVQEYKLVMSERASVHKEMEQLTNKLTQSEQKVQRLDHDNHRAYSDLQKLQTDIKAARHSRDLSMLDSSTKEVESLHKELEQTKNELKEMQQECENSKKQRDWAFRERDKIVQERESIRTLCDRLRRERDRSVSDLAEALRELDDVRKKKKVPTATLR